MKNWILVSLMAAGFFSGCDTFGTSTGEHNQPCFGDGTCLEGLICDSASDTCILPEEDCGDRECGQSPNEGFDCGTCTGETESCVSGRCLVLEWQDPPEDVDMIWQQAIDYCADLSLYGHSDWHLPTISELRSLIRGCSAIETGGSCGVTDDCLSYYACRDSFCEGCFVGQGPAGCYWPTGMEGSCFTYWSSSPCEDGDDGDGAWSVDFNSGHVYSFVKTGGYYVRCVRRGE